MSGFTISKNILLRAAQASLVLTTSVCVIGWIREGGELS